MILKKNIVGLVNNNYIILYFSVCRTKSHTLLVHSRKLYLIYFGEHTASLTCF